MSLHIRSDRFRRARSRRDRGQALTEFALIWPIFVVCVMALIEFGIAFNNLLTVNYASRNAALLGAEAGDDHCADVIILASIEQNMSAPAAADRIAQVDVYYSSADGAQLTDTGQSGADTWMRAGSTSCMFDATTYTVPYTMTSQGYPYWDRCNAINGCSRLDACGASIGATSQCHASLDTIGVKITYRYGFITPLSSAITLLDGSGNLGGAAWTFVQSQQMRMEPIQ